MLVITVDNVYSRDAVILKKALLFDRFEYLHFENDEISISENLHIRWFSMARQYFRSESVRKLKQNVARVLSIWVSKIINICTLDKKSSLVSLFYYCRKKNRYALILAKRSKRGKRLRNISGTEHN